MKSYPLLLALPFLMAAPHAFPQEERMVIDADFPGGNIMVDAESVEEASNSTLYYTVAPNQETVHLRADYRDTIGHWFYWSFRVRGAEGRTVNFQFDGKRVGVFGPAYSNDGGESWQWLFDEPKRGDSFSYTFGENESDVRFSVGIPYLQADFDQFIKPHLEHPHLSMSRFTESTKGRTVEKLIIHNPQAPVKHKVVITARHHACEMMASYVLEGLVTSLLSDKQDMSWLRDNVEFLIVPFMDKDGVQDGDQGKNRRPHDHNRDYAGESIYTTTAAIREAASTWGEGKLRVGLDLHCPYLFGPKHEYIHMVGSGNEDIEREQLKFSKILERSQQGELQYNPESFLSFGTDWNTGTKDGKMNFASFIASHDSVTLATTLEFPYAINYDQQVTPDNARQFGQDLARALAIYLQQLEE